MRVSSSPATDGKEHSIRYKIPRPLAYPRYLTTAAAHAVGTAGRIVGVDLSPGMLKLATARATQRNLAAMVADPTDLVQPRAETPAYTERRTTVLEHYRTGAATSSTENSESTAGRITDIGH